MSDKNKTTITGDQNIVVQGVKDSQVNITVNPSPFTAGKQFTIDHPLPREIIMDRTPLLEELHRRFRSGSRWVVVSGKEGAGKTSLAAFYFKQWEDRYDKTGWVNYQLTLFHSFVNALSTEVPETDERKKMATLSLAQHQTEDAIAYFEKAIAIREHLFPAGHPDTEKARQDVERALGVSAAVVTPPAPPRGGYARAGMPRTTTNY